MQTKFIEQYFFFGLLLGTLFFTFLIFKPFWAVLVLGMSFAIVLHPVFLWFQRRKLPNWLASFLTVLLFLILLCIPLLSIGGMVFNQSQNVYQIIVSQGSTESLVGTLNTSINNMLPAGISFNLSEKISDLVSLLSDNIAQIFSTTVSAILSFILMLLVIFYFLKDGKKWREAMVILSPLADSDDEKIISRLTLAVNSVIKGYLFIALIQGTLMGFGLWFFGVPNPALWGVIAAITSLLPTIGTAFVSIPAIIFLLAIGNTTGAIGLMIWAIVAVGMIDNFLSPLIVGGKTNIPSLMILFSVLGGISFMGPVGILVGPLAVSLLYTLISIYRNEFRQSVVLS